MCTNFILVITANRGGAMEARNHFKNGASLKRHSSKREILQRLFLLFAFFCVSVASTFAQDVITLKNGDEIQAIVQEIGEVDIKYKKYDNPNGPNYTLKKADIFMIRYANGSRDVFVDNSAPVMPTSTKASEPNNQQNGQNLADNRKKYSDFTLKKSSKIMIDIYGFARPGRNRLYKSLEEKLGILGFCCVYRKTDMIDNSAGMVIIVYPNDPVTWAFRIRDKAIDMEVYYKRIAHMTTINNTTDKFIRDITLFIEE